MTAGVFLPLGKVAERLVRAGGQHDQGRSITLA
jgi:hypothetical protein